MFLINDRNPNNLVSTRLVYRDFLKEGYFSAYEEYPFRNRVVELSSVRKMEEELKAEIYKYKPECIHWIQLLEIKLSDSFLNWLDQLNPRPVITQETVDNFFSLPKGLLKAGRVFDMTLVNCGCKIPELRKKGCRNVILFPEKGEEREFGKPIDREKLKQYDVIMIANRIRGKNPFRVMDGQRVREKLVGLFTKKFQKKFAIFGYGWDKYPTSKGFLKFSEQERIIHKAKIVLGTNNWNDCEYYFSNRVPISLLSGIPHLCQRSKGIEYFFKDGKHCIFFDTPEEALKKAQWLINQPQDYLDLIGEAGRTIVLERHTVQKRYQYYLGLVKAYKENRLNEVIPDYFLKIPERFQQV